MTKGREGRWDFGKIPERLGGSGAREGLERTMK
jgi:hypothetical protein